jgi:Plasmid pRiA4b ORF-3-like protein
MKVPTCLGGERRCPPEDVGGVAGYEEFLEVIVDPAHEEHDHYVHWAGGHFLDEFDLKAVNETLSRMRWPVRHRR